MLPKYGKLVPPNQPELLAEAIGEFAEADFASQRQELRSRIEERFSWEANVERLTQIYEELI